ncbi:MAG: 23S rRNA (adenine(2503)-C(2))-methyltransferase RlmN [Armatimonadota bacterium]|nr:23S rRNA (adenine(2503)-C(2))-methyltransferase RlmN [Armatimonadota bacterium]MDR5702947.1 23S rRNA (adenine(2503)-C(2))-methyltransferase RlmN [Armatimonadota bacterium]MDR7433862.1 23S rRNA (adenine(2503)-C(2))-methyltransferase RlmN [Armatimonadota bacterium]
MQSLFDLSLEELTEILAGWGEPRYRARQIWAWAYRRGATEFEGMTDLPKSLRVRLAQTFTLSTLRLIAERVSSDGWTRKWLFALPDGTQIEAVLMEYTDRRTACVSTQAGCAMGCAFCATGQMGLLRNLTTGEIIEQVLWVGRWLASRGERLTHVVFMGMGEPLANYGNTAKALRLLIHPDGFRFGQRRITVSTVGIVPGIRRFAQEGWEVNLAISLHAATDDLRNRLVPINRIYPLQMLMAAARDYVERTRRRLTCEWVMIHGVNDTMEQANALVEWIRGMLGTSAVGHLVHVNLIPLNPTPGFPGEASPPARIEAFRRTLEKARIPCTVRVRRGIDVAAGCGQLRAEITGRKPLLAVPF